jgi:hypothetical protein
LIGFDWGFTGGTLPSWRYDQNQFLWLDLPGFAWIQPATRQDKTDRIMAGQNHRKKCAIPVFGGI